MDIIQGKHFVQTEHHEHRLLQRMLCEEHLNRANISDTGISKQFGVPTKMKRHTNRYMNTCDTNTMPGNCLLVSVPAIRKLSRMTSPFSTYTQTNATME